MYEKLIKLDASQEREFWKHYLVFLAKSINIECVTTPSDVFFAEGWGVGKNGYSWGERTQFWYKNSDVCGYDLECDEFTMTPLNCSLKYVIPIFPNYANRALAKALASTPLAGATKENIKPSHTKPFVPTTKESNTMNNTMNNTLNVMKEKNITAAEITAKVATGKTANSFFLTKLLGKFPWYVKLFSRKQDAVNSPVAKLVTAQTAMVLATHFAPDNAKLNYIADAMVTEAMIDLTVNSEMLERMIGELEDMVTLPAILDKKIK